MLAIITARGGSVRLRNKNIRSFAGKPLIAYSILAARDAGRIISRLVVTTDSPEIVEIACQWGAEVPFLRPAELATASATTIDTMQHCAAWVEKEEGRRYRWILLLQPTSPLRTAADIIAAIRLAESRNATSVIGVTEFPLSEFDKLKVLDHGYLRPSPLGGGGAFGDRTVCYAVNGSLYLTRWDTVMEDGDLYGRRSLPLVIPPERAVDVDTEADFRLAECLYKIGRDGQSAAECVAADGTTPDEAAGWPRAGGERPGKRP